MLNDCHIYYFLVQVSLEKVKKSNELKTQNSPPSSLSRVPLVLKVHLDSLERRETQEKSSQ